MKVLMVTLLLGGVWLAAGGGGSTPTFTVNLVSLHHQGTEPTMSYGADGSLWCSGMRTDGCPGTCGAQTTTKLRSRCKPRLRPRVVATLWSIGMLRAARSGPR